MGLRSLQWSFCLIVVATHMLVAEDRGLVAYWPFDSATGATTKRADKQVDDKILGNFTFVSGARGNGIKFDGFTTRITRDSESAPAVEGAATFETWIAPQAYPWNWSAIVERKKLIFLRTGCDRTHWVESQHRRQLRECVSTAQIPFMKWSHIAATFDAK